jgi:hypothetical protein
MRQFAAAAFLAALMGSGSPATGQEHGEDIKLTPEMLALQDQIDQRKKELEILETEWKKKVKVHEARIAFLTKELQEREKDRDRLMNAARAGRPAEARKATTNDKLDLILKKLESLEKRILDLEKKDRAPGGAGR